MSEPKVSERVLDAFRGLDREGFDWEACLPLVNEVAALEAELEVAMRLLDASTCRNMPATERWLTRTMAETAAQQEGK